MFTNVFFNKILDICHETLDLARDEVELTVTRRGFVFQSVSSGYAVTIIADEANKLKNETGIHQIIDDSFSEYELSELLERACNSGYDQIILHCDHAGVDLTGKSETEKLDCDVCGFKIPF